MEIVAERAPPVRRRAWKLPLILFLATCLSTLLVGGPVYALCVMTILVFHEAGHFVQARRYGIHSTYPIFLPMPFSPLGTLGAVIAMDSRIPDRKALYDIGITGPLAGLVPTLTFCVLGVWFDAYVAPSLPAGTGVMEFGEPLLFKALTWLRFGPLSATETVVIGPMALAGWVGLLVTAINLMPIGQLDGGHVLYAMLRRRAHSVAVLLLWLGVGLILWAFWTKSMEYTGWSLMLLLLAYFGPRHPPTADDYVPLGGFRLVLGWLTLAFLIVGFTPAPFKM